jgi:NAD(P)-dependent dehydrogenase (short-subunit alcohol dehydrogenase family)
VLTGATRGLGAALVREFVSLGHTVLGCGRSVEGVARVRAAHPAPHEFEVVDVADARTVERWAHGILDRHGAPDLLINNAALINANAPLWKVPARELSAVVDVNIKGVVNVIRHFVPAMAARKSGVIVNFSSYWGRSAAADVAPYCATKWAVEGLTAALAEELPQGMAAVPLNPGIIDTDMLRSCFGNSAGSYPKAAQWAAQAVPFILGLTAQQNGRPLTVPS